MCTPTELSSSDANGLLDGLEFTQPDDRLVVLIREFEKLDCVFHSVVGDRWGVLERALVRVL